MTFDVTYNTGRPCVVTPMRGDPIAATWHAWSIENDGARENPMQYPVGIIEYADGTCDTIHPCRIKFTDK
jgi:hypothetical protein